MAKNTIVVKSYLNIREQLTATAVAITPGFLIERTSTSGYCQAHSTEAGNVLPMFAVEDELQGKLISDNYAVSATIQAWIPTRGDVVYALLDNGENVAIGDFLESAGNGKLQKHAADSAGAVEAANPIVGRALQAVDMSGSSGVDPNGRILVEIL